MTGQMIRRVSVILIFGRRHPERSRFSGEARDLAGSMASLKWHIAPAALRFIR
jgi:hypothetical protein